MKLNDGLLVVVVRLGVVLRVVVGLLVVVLLAVVGLLVVADIVVELRNPLRLLISFENDDSAAIFILA